MLGEELKVVGRQFLTNLCTWDKKYGDMGWGNANSERKTWMDEHTSLGDCWAYWEN